MERIRARTYDKEFKLNAVKLYLSSGKSYSTISQELGIPSKTLVGWVHSYRKEQADAFPRKGHLKPSEVEATKLRKELAIIREERDILKKALAAQEQRIGIPFF